MHGLMSVKKAWDSYYKSRAFLLLPN